MYNELNLLIVTAISIAFFHTILGPDHYLPFIVLSKSNRWSIKKTFVITILCGIGHILSSIIIGIIGIIIGIAIFNIESIESIRGNFAAWLLMIFGFIYIIWSLKFLVKSKKHSHSHYHMENNSFHSHKHDHFSDHSHMHTNNSKKLTPWALFLIFIFGPCEPLVPILMYPAAKNNFFGVLIVTTVFAITTIATMLIIVLIFSYGLHKISLKKYEKYSHTFAGVTVFLCGIAMVFWEL